MFKLSGGFVTCIPKLKGMNTLLGEANLSGVFCPYSEKGSMLYRGLPRKGVLNIEFAPSGDMVSRKANRKLQRLSPLGEKCAKCLKCS